MVTIQKSSNIEKAKNIDPWKFFQMKDFSLSQIREHVPELLDDEEMIDYELALQAMFHILKRVCKIAQGNQYALGAR